MKNWTIKDWDAIYSDLPSRQTKLPVEDRTKIQCNETETQVTSPVDLQNEINTLVQQVDQGRAFVRPSGTEPKIKFYFEVTDELKSRKDFDATEKRVKVILQGACSGCPSSTFTLKNGIENMLKDMLKDQDIKVEAINA